MSEQPANQNNGMESGQDSDSLRPRTLEGEILKRKRRRRLDLKTVNGTLRESSRIYRDLAEGRISLAVAEVRSRVLRRHGELLTAVEKQQTLERLAQAVREGNALLGGSPLAQIEHVVDQESGR